MPVFGDDDEEPPFKTLSPEKAAAMKTRAEKVKAPNTYIYTVVGESGGAGTLGECLAKAFRASLYHLRAERGRESVPVEIVSQCGECKGVGHTLGKRGFARQRCKTCDGDPCKTVAAFDARLPESFKIIG